MGEFGWANRWWVGSGCGLWRWWVDFHGLWVIVVGGSAGDGRIGGGADLCFDLFLSLLFCFGGCDLVVDSTAVVG